MFYELQSQVWTPSGPSVVITTNTDTSIDGSCRKIVWTNALNEFVTIGFTAVDLSQWEELSLYIQMQDQLTDGPIFKFTIGGTDYDITRDHLKMGYWKRILIDCHAMGNTNSIIITSLVANLTILIDYIGYRKVTDNADMDIISALKSKITLDYGVATTLAADAAAGATAISLTNKAYQNDITAAQLDDGGGTTETVLMTDLSGTLETALTNSFTAGDIVRLICPTLSEDFDSVEPDPICAIKVFDADVNKELSVEKTINGSKIKEFLGALGILIYIDCSSKKKLLQLKREYDRKYGQEFQILLDGEQVEVYLEAGVFTDDMIGNNPRMSYYYRIEPQPYLYCNSGVINTINITVTSTAP